MLLLTLFGCTQDEPAVQDSVTAEVTYYADVKPLLDVHCTRCHYDGGLGVGDFTDPDLVNAMAEIMLSKVEAGEMPPPVSDPEGCHDFEGSDQLRMSDTEIADLADWIDQGKVMGDPADDPQLTALSGELSDPDLSVLMPAAYTPAFADADNPGNEYRCFVVDPALTAPTYITALAPIIDSAPLVHHIVLAVADRDDVDQEYLDPSGYDCIDGQGPGDDLLVAWAPGMLPIEFPDASGLPLGPEQVLILQMHYFQNPALDAIPSDRSGYAFRTTDAVDKEMIYASLGIYDFEIPADEPAHVDSGSLVNDFGVGLSIWGVFPHMHVLGSEYSMWIDKRDGSQDCVVEGAYDFDNQLTYTFEEAVPFAREETLHFECVWDNSASNPDATAPYQDTRYGERTNEEMCFFFTYVTTGL